MECIRRGYFGIIIWIVYGMDGSKYFVLCDVHHGDNSYIYDSIFVGTLPEGFEERRRIVIEVNVEIRPSLKYMLRGH